MSEDPEKAPDDERAEPLAGKRLAEARCAREISIHDVAKELHLDEPRVRALEENRFDILGAPVFVKGYLRKYAEIVGVAADQVLADYRRLDQGEQPPPIVGPRRKPPREISPGPWLAAILIIVVVAGGAWAWMSGALDPIFDARDPATLAPFAAGEPGSEDGPETPEPGPVEDMETAPAAAAEPFGQPPRTEREPEPQATPAMLEAPEAAPPGEGEVTLGLTFSGDCWTEVSDAAGERLYFGLGKAGGTVSVTGTAPLHVLLGDSENAAVMVNGKSYPIPRSALRGDTARLTITAP